MSLISSVANYGGRQSDNQQGIKQFVISPQNYAYWVFKNKMPNQFITPESKEKNVLIPKDLYVNNDLYVENNIYNVSDRNKKKNIENVTDIEASYLLQLKPKTFQYIKQVDKEEEDEEKEKEEKPKNHYGLIAQEVEEIFPDLVNTSLFGDKNINYIELIPIMICKMKEMQKDIDNLKEMIKSRH
jgi:uncharacterized membrane protein